MTSTEKRFQDLEYNIARLWLEREEERCERDMVLIALTSLAGGESASTVLAELPMRVQRAAADRGQPPQRQEAAKERIDRHIARILALRAADHAPEKT